MERKRFIESGKKSFIEKYIRRLDLLGKCQIPEMLDITDVKCQICGNASLEYGMSNSEYCAWVKNLLIKSHRDYELQVRR